MQPDYKKRRKTLFIFCIILFVALIGLAAYRHFTNTSKNASKSAMAPVPAVTCTIQS